MVNIRKKIIAGTLALTMSMTTLGGTLGANAASPADSATAGITNTTALIQAVMSGAVTLQPYAGATGFTWGAKQTKMTNRATTNLYCDNGSIQNRANGTSIILVGDSRVHESLQLDYKSGKKLMSGYAHWGGSYTGSTITAGESKVKDMIKTAFSKGQNVHIWVFGTINDTGRGKTAQTAIENYIKRLTDYCNKSSINKGHKATIHIVNVVPGTSKWVEVNGEKNAYVKAYNASLKATFPNDSKNKNVTYKINGYSNIINGTSKYCYNEKSGYANDGLHYTPDAIRAINDWIYNSSK